MMYVIVSLLLLIAVLLMSGYNRLVKLRNNVKEAYSTMDVYLKKRFDLIPNIVETVKRYVQHEKETFENITKARAQVQLAGTTEEKIASEQVLGGTIKTLFAVAENYPDLKSNTNFLALQKELSNIEEEIALARKYYNGCVKMMNNAVEMFPSNIIANLFHFESMPLFELEDIAERANVGVKF